MRNQVTIYRTIEDCYSPYGEEIEVAIEVEFSIAPAEPDVGVMSAYPEDICLLSTDSDQCTPEQANAWLESRDFDRERDRAFDRISDACSDADY
jgi:hypothetical protein